MSDNPYTPIHDACISKPDAEAATLVGSYLDDGVDPNLRTKSTGQDTPLMLAALYNKAETVATLLKRGAKVDLVDANGQSALAKAKTKLKVNTNIIEDRGRLRWKEIVSKGKAQNFQNINAALKRIVSMLEEVSASQKQSPALTALTEAEALREQGNALFLKKRYEEAIVKYKDSLNAGTDYRCYSNISQCYLNMAKHQRSQLPIGTSSQDVLVPLFIEAKLAAMKAIELCPTDTKAIYRRSVGWMGEGFVNRALGDLAESLQHAPTIVNDDPHAAKFRDPLVDWRPEFNAALTAQGECGRCYWCLAPVAKVFEDQVCCFWCMNDWHKRQKAMESVPHWQKMPRWRHGSRPSSIISCNSTCFYT